MTEILLVDDEHSIKQVVEQALTKEGFKVIYAQDGEEAQKKFEKNAPDLIILDIMLPKIDGFELCRRWREISQVPILILSAKDDIVDKSVGFNHGADDYLTKPFSPVELSLRVKALLRRRNNEKSTDSKEKIELPGLEIDGFERSVKVEEEEIYLTPKEFELLWFLANHPNQVFTKEQLFKRIWNKNAVGDTSTVTVFIRKLRKKIEPDPSKPTYLQTVWGVGYKFCKD